MMKKILLLILLLLLSSLFITANAWANWCEDISIVACYLVETGSGTTMVDSSSSSLDGDFKGAGEPAWAASAGTGNPSYSDWAIDFDGSDAFVELNANFGFGGTTDDFTLMTWFNTDAVNDSQVILGRFDGSSKLLQFDIDASNARVKAVFGTGGFDDMDSGVSSVDAGTWYHLTLGFDTDGSSELFLDGVSVDTDAAVTGDFTAATEIRFGLRGGDNAAPYEGLIDETGAFSDLKDGTEINDIIDNGLLQEEAPAPTPTGFQVMMIN